MGHTYTVTILPLDRSPGHVLTARCGIGIGETNTGGFTFFFFFWSQKDAIVEKGQEIWPGLTELIQELGFISSTVE